MTEQELTSTKEQLELTDDKLEQVMQYFLKIHSVRYHQEPSWMQRAKLAKQKTNSIKIIGTLLK